MTGPLPHQLSWDTLVGKLADCDANDRAGSYELHLQVHRPSGSDG